MSEKNTQLTEEADVKVLFLALSLFVIFSFSGFSSQPCQISTIRAELAERESELDHMREEQKETASEMAELRAAIEHSEGEV